MPYRGTFVFSFLSCLTPNGPPWPTLSSTLYGSHQRMVSAYLTWKEWLKATYEQAGSNRLTSTDVNKPASVTIEHPFDGEDRIIFYSPIFCRRHFTLAIERIDTSKIKLVTVYVQHHWWFRMTIKHFALTIRQNKMSCDSWMKRDDSQNHSTALDQQHHILIFAMMGFLTLSQLFAVSQGDP